MDLEELALDGTRFVTILRIGDVGRGKELAIPTNWSHSQLMDAIEKRIGLEPPFKIYNRDGSELKDVDLIQPNDILYVGTKEAKRAASSQFLSAKGSSSAGASSNDRIGNYILDRFLGKGGFGEVRLAHHFISNEQFAIKFIRKEGIKDFQNAARMSSEIMALTVLRHPNLLHMYEVIDSPDATCYVMEYLPGGDLLQYIVAHGELKEIEAFKYFQQIYSGVEYCHSQNIIHRDLKLENLLLSKDQKQLKIADFGLCGVVVPDVTDQHGGTRAYAAPELFRGKVAISSAMDIWSMGVILYAMLFGRLPFNTENGPASVDNILAGKYTFQPNKISSSCQDLISKMLTVNFKKRATLVDIYCHPWTKTMRRKVTWINTDAGKHTAEDDDILIDDLEDLMLVKSNTLKGISSHDGPHHSPKTQSSFFHVSMANPQHLLASTGTTPRTASSRPSSPFIESNANAPASSTLQSACNSPLSVASPPTAHRQSPPMTPLVGPVAHPEEKKEHFQSNTIVLKPPPLTSLRPDHRQLPTITMQTQKRQPTKPAETKTHHAPPPTNGAHPSHDSPSTSHHTPAFVNSSQRRRSGDYTFLATTIEIPAEPKTRERSSSTTAKPRPRITAPDSITTTHHARVHTDYRPQQRKPTSRDGAHHTQGPQTSHQSHFPDLSLVSSSTPTPAPYARSRSVSNTVDDRQSAIIELGLDATHNQHARIHSPNVTAMGHGSTPTAQQTRVVDTSRYKHLAEWKAGFKSYTQAYRKVASNIHNASQGSDDAS